LGAAWCMERACKILGDVTLLLIELDHRWRAESPDNDGGRRLLGLDLAVPDHSTLSRRAKTLEVPHLRRAGTGPLHLLVDSTGRKLGGAGEWLVEKHGTSRRRSWRKLHIGVDADSGEIVAVAVTRKDIDDATTVDALLDQIVDPQRQHRLDHVLVDRLGADLERRLKRAHQVLADLTASLEIPLTGM